MATLKKTFSSKSPGSKDGHTPYKRIIQKIAKDEKSLRKMLTSFFELGQLIALELNLEEMLLQIAKKAAAVIGADRYNLFLHDQETDELWTPVSVGKEGRNVRIPAGRGISGYSFRTGETVNLKDAYADPRFYKPADVETNYRTKTMLSMPLYNRSGNVFGVIHLTNKKKGMFTGEDEVFLKLFNNHASVFIEMAQLQKARFDALEKSREELEQLSRAKDKAMYHLSHELRTPVSVIQGGIKILKRKLEGNDIKYHSNNLFDILEKNIERISTIQQETDKIIRTYQEVDNGVVLCELESQWRELEDVAEIPVEIKLHWDMVKKWISSNAFGSRGTEITVSAVSFIDKILKKIKGLSSHRDISFETDYRADPSILIIPGVQESVLEGLLKNAVENTPDGGLIRIILSKKDDKVILEVEDYGIGITEENRDHIFDGFFYTQDTDLYSSMKPYDFGAGGKGLALMLAKVYGQRFDFQVSFKSKRCVYIPTNKDVCPGKISLCRFCKSREDCIASGGSVFKLAFPSVKNI